MLDKRFRFEFILPRWERVLKHLNDKTLFDSYDFII